MSLISRLPFLNIFEYYHHRILKLRTAHWACNRHIRIFFVSCPNFKTFSMQAFFTGFASRVAFAIHLFIANWTHRILLKWRKIIHLLIPLIIVMTKLFKLMLLLFFSLLFSKFVLDKSF
jgi:hypothetical protein